jgi:hypothetical protein
VNWVILKDPTMLRINTSMLVQSYDLWYYNGAPFTGVAFAIDASHRVEANKYHEGRISGRYLNEYLEPNGPVYPKVDWDYLGSDNEDDPKPLNTFQGQVFSGIAYSFEGHFCLAESYYEDGSDVSDVFYSESGRITRIALHHTRFGQIYEFDEAGNLLRCELTARPEFDFRIHRDGAGNLKGVLMRGDGFQGVSRRRKEVYFAGFVDKRDLLRLGSSDKLWLAGDGINDEFFGELLDNRCISGTICLSLMDVAITAVSIDRLANCAKLRSLSITDSPSISSNDVKLFRSRRPDCAVIVDRVVM